jgi:Zn-dependent protease with chaperone function
MDVLNWIALQLFQPYFYYPLVLSLALFVGVNLAVRFTRIKDHRLRSYLFALPMLSPILVYLLFPPQLNILVVENGSTSLPFPSNPMDFMPPPHLPLTMQSFLSVTGSLCLGGILLGASLLAFCLVMNRYGTKRGFVPISEEDYPKVIGIVAKRCKHFGIDIPYIGLAEDLRPNAFVGGHGRSAVLVFSLGMLETFDQAELTVAIDHELMHLKNRDTIFRSVSIGLIALSFFNPIAYLSYSATLREREHLADDGSTPTKKAQQALRSALRKAAETTSFVEGMASVNGLRFIGLLPLFPRNMLATHPAEQKRLESISRSNRERKASPKAIILTVLCVVVLSGVLLAVFVDTRDILVQGSSVGVNLLGTDGHHVIDHAIQFNVDAIQEQGHLSNKTLLPPSSIQGGVSFQSDHPENISLTLVATK